VPRGRREGADRVRRSSQGCGPPRGSGARRPDDLHLIVLFTPIPPQLLDFLILTNFSFALLLLLLTFYVEKPVEFSTFPSLLLIATLFRLSLNIGATRLIFTNADAGKVIAAMGSYVVGGNYVVGLIVFVILVSSSTSSSPTVRSAWPKSPPGSRSTACPGSR